LEPKRIEHGEDTREQRRVCRRCHQFVGGSKGREHIPPAVDQVARQAAIGDRIQGDRDRRGDDEDEASDEADQDAYKKGNAETVRAR
jgi:hypothetical protein